MTGTMEFNTMAKILAFAGSTRSASVNQKLLDVAIAVARNQGAEVTDLRLAEYPLPLFDQDLEEREGQPENAAKLKELFKSHDAILVACPEYNSSITPLLKNTIDWLSRPADGEPMLAAFAGKTAGLLSASPGGFGGLRGLRHVREILSNISVLVTPKQFALSKAHEAFTESGDALVDERQQTQLEACVEQLVTTASKLSG